MKLTRRGKHTKCTKRAKRTKRFKIKRNTKKQFRQYKRKNTHRKHSHKLKKNKRVMRGGEGEELLKKILNLTYNGFFFNSTGSFETSLIYTGKTKQCDLESTNTEYKMCKYKFELTIKKKGSSFKAFFTVKPNPNSYAITYSHTTVPSTELKTFDVPEVKDSKDKIFTIKNTKKENLNFPLSSQKNNDFFKELKGVMVKKVGQLLAPMKSKELEERGKLQEKQKLEEIIKETKKKIIASFNQGVEQVEGYEDVYQFKKDLDELKEKCSKLTTLYPDKKDKLPIKVDSFIERKVDIEVKKKLLGKDSDSDTDLQESIGKLTTEVSLFQKSYEEQCEKINSNSEGKNIDELVKHIINYANEYENKQYVTKPNIQKLKKLKEYIQKIKDKFNLSTTYPSDDICILICKAISKFFEYTLVEIAVIGLFNQTQPNLQQLLSELSDIENSLGIQDIRDEPVTQREKVSYDERGNEIYYKPPNEYGVDVRTGETYKLPKPERNGDPDQRDLATDAANRII